MYMLVNNKNATLYKVFIIYAFYIYIVTLYKVLFPCKCLTGMERQSVQMRLWSIAELRHVTHSRILHQLLHRTSLVKLQRCLVSRTNSFLPLSKCGPREIENSFGDPFLIGGLQKEDFIQSLSQLWLVLDAELLQDVSPVVLIIRSNFLSGIIVVADVLK